MKKLVNFITAMSILVGACISCQQNRNQSKNAADKEDTLEVYTLENKEGNEIRITNFGAKVMSIMVPDKNGNKGNIVLGYDSANQYIKGNLYFGAIVGRYGNRIAKGKFTLDGRTYQLAENNGENHLHGGPGGFHNVIWEAKKIPANNGEALELSYLSKDGEEGYPGNLSIKVIYTWTDNNELWVDYEASTDKKTVLNPTHHSFFNLKDAGKSPITAHQLMINADTFLPVDETLIPTGERKLLEGTPFDFRKMHEIGEAIDREDLQLKFGRGYDHNFILNPANDSLNLAAEVYEPTTGRVMQVYTDQPGLQFYSGNFLDGSDTGHNGTVYQYRTAFCLEAQHFPDSPNHPDFPSTVLEPGQVYKQTTIYRFFVKDVN